MRKIIKNVKIYLWSVVLILIDQISKIIVIKNLKDTSITVINGILKFNYCENRGVAFSILEGKIPLFIIITSIIIIGLIIYYEKLKNKINLFQKISISIVLAGGISNLIDRIFRGYVIDFIDINELFTYAIFNIADIFIVLGIIGMGISILITKEEK